MQYAFSKINYSALHTSHFTPQILQLTPNANKHKNKEITPSVLKLNPGYNTKTELKVKPIIPK